MSHSGQGLVFVLPFPDPGASDGSTVPQTPRAVSQVDAIAGISERRYELAGYQDEPPMELLDHARSLLSKVDRVGPEVGTSDLVDRVGRSLFHNQARPAIVKGREIRWFYQSIIFPLGELLTSGDFDGPNLFKQLKQVFGTHRERSAVKEYQSAVPDEDCRRLGMLIDTNYPAFHYRLIGASWLEFHAALVELGREFDALTLRCLGEGRILAVDQFDHGLGLIPPTRWRREDCTLHNLHFAFSRDLPSQWFNESRGPRNRIAREAITSAIGHLEMEYRRLGPGGKPMTKADLIKKLREDFGLGKNAVEEAWRKAEIPAWKQGGRPTTKPT